MTVATITLQPGAAATLLQQNGGAVRFATQLRSRPLTAAEATRIFQWDRAWLDRATLVDARQPIICGGGGCNVPYCTWQMWRVNADCTKESFSSVMFQLERFILAQNALREHLKERPALPPGMDFSDPMPRRDPQISSSDRAAFSAEMTRWYAAYKEQARLRNEAIAANATEWSQWIYTACELVAVARWSSNVRWEMALRRRPDLAPLEAALFGIPSQSTKTAVQYYQVPHPELGEFKRPPLFLSFDATLYEQEGDDGRAQFNKTGPNVPQGGGWTRNGSGADRLPPILPVKVPRSNLDFAPALNIWSRRARSANRQRPFPIREAPYGQIGYNFGVEVPWAIASNAWTITGGSFRSDFRDYALNAASAVEPASRTYDTGAAVPELQQWINSPYSIAQYAWAMAMDTTTVTFHQVLAAAADEYLRLLKPLAEQGLIGATVAQLDQLSRAASQAQIDEARLTTGIVFGTTTAAVSVIPVVGQIAAVVIAIIGFIVDLLLQFAQDLGLTRRQNPPCPPSPFLRIIPPSAAAETNVCNFDPREEGAAARVAAQVTTIRDAAARGESLDKIFDRLKDLEAGGARPQLFNPANLVVGATAVVGGLLLARRFRGA